MKGAALVRPAPDAGTGAWIDYVYLRDNPRGAYEEYWHHTSGCRRWLVVSRDTATHEISGSRDVVLDLSAEAL
ncbi:sarcosine oxidase subunit delta [Mesorhizobium sp. L2C066B000]|nr:sarcosine oxidase subunit delta [Mesorhizobium sp. L2C066B000]